MVFRDYIYIPTKWLGFWVGWKVVGICRINSVANVELQFGVSRLSWTNNGIIDEVDCHSMCVVDQLPPTGSHCLTQTVEKRSENLPDVDLVIYYSGVTLSLLLNHYCSKVQIVIFYCSYRFVLVFGPQVASTLINWSYSTCLNISIKRANTFPVADYNGRSTK